MNDLSTEIRIGADASGVEAGVGRAKRSLKDLGDSARSAGQTVAAAGKQAGESLATVGDGGEAAAKKIQRDTRSMQSSLQRYLATLEAGSKDSRKYWESMADFKGVDKAALRPLLDQLDAYKAKANAAADASSAFKLSVGGFGVAATALTAVSATAGVAAKAMFDASVSAERLRTMLDFSTGGNSAREIEYLRGVTARLGLEFTSTAKAYGQFQAAAKGTALEGDKARAVFESVAKASAVMGLSADDTSGVLLALQQMLSKGTVSAEELRGQLGERLPGSFQVAARAMGVTTAELGKMLEQGQIVADDFLPKFGKALEQNLGGAAEKAANRLDAAVNRFENAWERLKKTGGDSGVSKAVSSELAAITRDIDAVSDGMERARRAGGGMFAELGSGAAVAAGRVAFSTLNLAANSLNGTINALTGGIFGLRTDLALLPDVFKTDAQYAKALADRLAEAEAKMAALQGTGASASANPYIRSSFVELQEYIKELKKAQAEQAKLTGVPVVGVNEGIVAQGRAREAYNTQRAKDEEAAAAFRLNLAGVPASYVKEMQELIRLNQAGIIVGKEYTDALKAQQDLLLKKTTTVRGSAAAANAEQNAYESLIASIRAKIEADNLEIAGGAALTESQRIRIKLDQDLAAGRVKLTAQNERAVRLALEELAASEASALAAKTLAKANLDAAASREKYLTSLSTGLDKIKADTAAQLEATARMGLSKEAIAELDAAKLEMLATDLELQAIKAMDRNLDEQTYSALKQQAEAYRELAAAKKAGATKEMALDLEKANREAAKKAADEWQRAADDINRSLTDALLRGFESGKGFAENLRSTLKNMFSTLVLRPIISAAMSPVAGAINGMLYGNAAAAAGGGANALGMLGSGANLITGLQGTQGMLGTVGGWLGLNTVATNAGLAATIGIDAASAAAAANAAGAAGGGLLSGVGAALPWIGGIAALVSILGGLDDSGTYHTGGAAQYSGARGLMSGQDATGYNIGFGRVEQGQETIDTVSRLAQGLAQSLDGVATSFGRTAGFEIATAFADDTSKDGAWGAFRISRDGKDLLNWENDRQSKWAPREFADGKEGYQQYLNAIAKDTRQVLMDMDLASWADKLLTGLGETPTMEALTNVIAQINQIQSAFEGLGNSMAMFADLTDEMQSGLLDAAGSIEALTAGAGAFYQGFYSEQERIDSAVAQLNETLAGLDLSIDPRLGDDAKDQFRAAVEAAFAAGDAELAAALLALSGTFANTADYFQQIAAQQADTMGRLQIDLLRAQGDNLAAVALERERELAALAQFGPAAVAMQQQIYDLIDAMAASNAAANAYFADIDRAAAEQGYNDDAQAALDAMFGAISGGADSAAQSAASAAADAAKAAAASWRSAASSIQSSLEKLRASTTALSDPASRYAETKSVLDEYTRLALGGDASAAEKLAGAADAFLSASADGTMTQAEYLRDRVLTEAKLASVMESSEAQASLQESIASSAGAAVSELQALNSNLTGFAGDLYDLLRSSYSDVGRDGATSIAATFAKMQADFDAYFNATTGWAAVGSKYSDPSFGGASFTKLDNNMAQFTGADGSIGYIRAGESLLDVAKRIPELRKLWEQTYNIRLPAFAVGTNYVPRDMLAQIHEGEAIVPKAFNPWASGGAGGADNAEVVAELRGLSSQLSRLEARLAEIEKTNDQMAQQQDNGTDGGNAYRAEIMNVAALAKAIKEATV